MKTIRCSVSVAMVSVFTSFGATTLTPSGTALQIDVPAGETNDVTSIDLSGVTDIRKTGLGGVVMKADITGYAGNIHVVEGTWRVVDSKGLGALTGGGTVYVENGATLEGCTDVKTGINHRGKTVCFEGSGVNGVGALVWNCTADQCGATWGENMIMTGDALIACLQPWYCYVLGSNNSKLTMNGHALTVKGPPSRRFIFGEFSVISPGRIISEGETQVTFQGYMNLSGDESNCWSVKGRSSFSTNKTYGYFPWLMEWDSTATNWLDAGSTAVTSAPKNEWSGPIRLLRTMATSLSAGVVKLTGDITGLGGLEFNGEGAGADLVSLGGVNSFEGGLRGEGVVFDLAAGAVPGTGKPFEAVDSDICLADSLNLLPTGIVTVATSSVVSNGFGRWKALIKDGPGFLDYNSKVGADILDVRNGSIRFPKFEPGIPAWMRGIVEGSGYYTSPRASGDLPGSQTDLYGGFAHRQRIVEYPTHLYTYYNQAIRKNSKPGNGDWLPEGGTTTKRYLITYSGYIWNHSDSDVTWTFAGNLGQAMSLRIDGETLFDDWDTSAATYKNITLSPGPHAIFIGNEGAINDGGSNNSAKNMDPDWNQCGVRYDPQGRNSNVKAYYQVLQNTPGELPLLTWTKPGIVVDYPSDDRVFENKVIVPGAGIVPVSDVPVFGTVTCAPGTAIDFNGNAYAVGTFEGVPTVSNCAALSITNRWRVSSADVMAGGGIYVPALSFGESTKFEFVAEGTVRGTREWTIATSESDIEGCLVFDEDAEPFASGEWKLTVEKRAIKLRHNGPGLIITIR